MDDQGFYFFFPVWLEEDCPETQESSMEVKLLFEHLLYKIAIISVQLRYHIMDA